MRIICPNCSAQYEVPDEVIPVEGRDVQCSNCGDTWYQTHPDAVLDIELAGDDSDGLPEPDAAPVAPAPQVETETDIEDELDAMVAEDELPEVKREAAPRRALSPDVADILRAEAEHEERLREAENSVFESQGELGLDTAPTTDTAQRVREARERMDLMRGKTVDAQPTLDASEAPSRKQFLPDIDELNSSLRAEGPGDTRKDLPVRHKRQKSRRGFGRGFSLMVLLGALMLLLYVNASDIGENFPAVAPSLDGFVDYVDRLRVWLDAQIRALTS